MSIKITLPLPSDLQPQTTAEQNQLMDDMIAWGRKNTSDAWSKAEARVGPGIDCLSMEFFGVSNNVYRRDSSDPAPKSENDFEQMVVEKYRRHWVAIYFIETASTRRSAPALDEGEVVRRSGRLD